VKILEWRVSGRQRGIEMIHSHDDTINMFYIKRKNLCNEELQVKVEEDEIGEDVTNMG
jgi:hypothetical protein